MGEVAQKGIRCCYTHHVFAFRTPISAEHGIEAVAEGVRDAMVIRHVDRPREDYVKGGASLTNWFDRAEELEHPGYFSIKDSYGQVKADSQARKVMEELVAPLQEKNIAACGLTPGLLRQYIRTTNRRLYRRANRKRPSWTA